MRSHLIQAIIVGLILLSGCTDVSRMDTSTNGKLESNNIVFQGYTRHYLAYIPANLPRNSSLLFVLHGSMGSPEQMRKLTAYRFEKLADKDHFIVIYPQGFEGHWDDCRKQASYSARTLHIDDVGFIRVLAQQFHQRYQINLKKVYVMGYSNGGHMAFRMALEAPDVVSGIAAISANLPTMDNMDCKISGKPVSVLLMNGTADPINPYRGGKVTLFGFGNRGYVMSSENSARWFAHYDRAVPVKLNQSLTSSAERSLWQSSQGKKVALYTIHGGGHTLPQPYTMYPLYLGYTNPGIDGPQEIWEFLSARDK